MRLIDASALIDALNNSGAQFNAEINKIIVEQPTAYDVEKVLEELNKEQEVWLRGYNQTLAMGLEHMWRNLSGRAYGVEQAIEIVKRGGVNVNV